MLTRNDVAVLVASALKESELSQESLAEAMRQRGWSSYQQITVSRNITGRRSIPTEEWLDLADLLAITGHQAGGVDVSAELVALRAFKRRILRAIKKGEAE